MRILPPLGILVFAATLASETSAATTMTYQGVTYYYSDSSTCPNGTSALVYSRRWWCPVSSTRTGSGSTTSTSTTSTSTTTYNAALSWTIPTTRTNGTALSLSELRGYEVYYTNAANTVSATLAVAGSTTTSTAISKLGSGTYYFAISAIDTSGLKSPLSTTASITFP